MDNQSLDSPSCSYALALAARHARAPYYRSQSSSKHHQDQPSPPPPAAASTGAVQRPASPVRYQSTPPSSRCYADILSPTPSFSPTDQQRDRSNDVDLQVKLALIDLLNCRDIKTDHESRMWVQNRLMDTEHRLKARRRSRVQCL